MLRCHLDQTTVTTEFVVPRTFWKHALRTTKVAARHKRLVKPARVPKKSKRQLHLQQKARHKEKVAKKAAVQLAKLTKIMNSPVCEKFLAKWAGKHLPDINDKKAVVWGLQELRKCRSELVNSHIEPPEQFHV